MKLYHHLKAKLLGRNSASTPVAVISEQMNEMRQLPLGAQEFEDWSERIISGVPPLLAVDKESMKFALATMIMQLGPQESHKPDIYFLKMLLKSAANQIAHAKMTSIKEERNAKLAAEETAKLEAEAKVKAQAEAEALSKAQAAADNTFKRIAEMELT